MSILTRYDSTAAQKEDILDMISQLTPLETPFFSRLGASQCRSALHYWITNTIDSATATGGASVEGASAVSRGLSDRSRVLNYTQITTETIEVSGTVEATSFYGLESEYATRLDEGMKRWKIMADIILLNSTSASGTSSVARQMSGAIDITLTNRQTGSATSCALTETVYNALLQTVADSGGGRPDTTFVGGFNKRRISAFATSNTRQMQVNETGKIANFVDVYMSDFGTQEIVYERYMPKTVGLVAQMDTYKIAWLRRPFVKPLADIGDSRRAEIIGEYTLEYLAESKSGVLSAFASA